MENDNMVMRALRSMAWQRAKGEMKSMLETYYERHDGDKFPRFKEAFEQFVKHVEDEGLQE